MKKLNKISAILIAFFFANTAFATKVNSAANGNMSNSGTWNSTPTNFDTVYIDHNVVFNGVLDWSSSTVNIVIISNGGSISPANTNASFRIPSGATIYIETGGNLINNSGNNSNHNIKIGSTCVWGKHCCPDNTTISGPALIDASNPCGYTPLPVQLLSFTAKRIDAASVHISWVTASEEQNQKFIVEYSNDGKSFMPIGEVLSAAKTGNSQIVLDYEFTDKRISLLNESGFYRIKQIDLNGDVGLISSIAMVKSFNQENILPVFVSQSLPGNNISLYISPDLAGLHYTVEVCSFSGQKIFSQTDNKTGFQNLEDLVLENGVYVVQIHFTDIQETISQKILVQ